MLSETKILFFDSPTWLQCEAPPDRENDLKGTAPAWQKVMQVTVRLPRLIALVRRARSVPRDGIAGADAMALADELYRLGIETWIEEVLDAGDLELHPTADPELIELAESSFRFPSEKASVVLVQFWEMRITVCGCIQALCALPSLAGVCWPWDLSDVRRAELQSARYLAMSLESMGIASGQVPALEIRQVLPLQMAFCAWYRLQNWSMQDGSRDSDVTHEAEKAQRMQENLLELQHRWAEDWHPARIDVHLTQVLADVWSGGCIPKAFRDHYERA